VQERRIASSPPTRTTYTEYTKRLEEEHIGWSSYLGKKYPIHGMCPISSSTLKTCIVSHQTLVTLGVLFFLTWSFFLKEGFGWGGFNEAPQIQ